MPTLRETWAAWEKEQLKKEVERYEAQFPKDEDGKPPKRPATESERNAIRALAGCHFAPGTWDKRFVHGLYTFDATQLYIADRIQPVTEITEKQAYWVWKLVWRYRRQLGLTDAQAREWLPKEAH